MIMSIMIDMLIYDFLWVKKAVLSLLYKKINFSTYYLNQSVQ